MAKDIINVLKIVIPAGKATPAPPLGPMLGQNGVPINEFTQQFNAKTKELGNVDVPCIVTIFKDRTFKIEVKQPTVVSMLKAKFGIQKGSGTPNKIKLKKVKLADLKEIAEKKLPDFNTKNIDSAIKIVAGVANSLGIEVVQ